jgi:hypothetical protein
LLFSLGHHVEVLDTHNTTTPGSSQGFVVVELSSEVLGEEFKILVVFLSHVSNGDASGSLLVDELTESFFSSNESVGNTLLSAESRQEDDHFNGVNIMSDDDELGLSLFDEFSDVVKTELKNGGLVLVVFLGSGGTSLVFSFLLESGLLFLFSFWTVLCK